jgi:hypothetical protein
MSVASTGYRQWFGPDAGYNVRYILRLGVLELLSSSRPFAATNSTPDHREISDQPSTAASVKTTPVELDPGHPGNPLAS